jgi:hypothetical protein
MDPRQRGLYAFIKYRKGEFLLFLNETDVTYDFMQLPDCYKMSFTKQEFKNGLTQKQFEFVEQVPEDVFETAQLNVKIA